MTPTSHSPAADAPPAHSPADNSPGALKLAKVYAQAIIEAAEKKQCRIAVLAELRAIVHNVLPKVPTANAVFASPRVTLEEKAAIIERICAGKVLPTTLHSLHVLARHGRLGMLKEVVAAAEQLANEREGHKAATFTTALALDLDEQGHVVTEIEQALGVSLAPTFIVNPDVLGGLVVRIADTVYDHSIATSLVRLGDRLKQRSIYEIQHRRDRLGTA